MEMARNFPKHKRERAQTEAKSEVDRMGVAEEVFGHSPVHHSQHVKQRLALPRLLQGRRAKCVQAEKNEENSDVPVNPVA